MRPMRLPIIGMVLAVLACGPAAAQAWSPERLSDPQEWHAQPDWLSNPAASARIELAPQAGLRFAVPEAGCGMKWQAALGRIWLSEEPWLVVRYRAAGLQPAESYFIWLEAETGVTAVRLDQVAADGRWHTLAVDASALAGDESLGTMAVQVQAAEAEAWVEIGGLAFAQAPPAQAEVLGGQPAAREDWLPDEHARRPWEPKPDWLPNPAEHHGYARRGEVHVFSVDDPGRGMKWALAFDEPLDPSGYRYLSLRIRGQGAAIVGDYSVCALGDALPDGRDYTVLAPAALAITRGRWQTVDLPLAPAHRHARLTGLAVQLQAWVGPATLEIADVRLTAARPARRLSDLPSLRRGWPRGAESLAVAVDLGRAAQMTVPQARARFGLADWFPQESLLVGNVPFKVRLAEGAVAATTGADESEVSVPVTGRASEVCLLLLARLIGTEESVRGGGPLMRISDPDRFRVILRYADGEVRAALPAQVPPFGFGLLEGVQVVCVRADPARDLRELTLYVGTPQARVGIAAITLNTTPHRRYEGLWEVRSLPPLVEAAAALPDLQPEARLEPGRLVLCNRHLRAEFDPERGLALTGLRHRAIGSQCVGRGEPRALFGVRLGERELGGEAFALAASEPLPEADGAGYRFTYRSSDPALEATVTLAVRDGPWIECAISLRNASGEPQTIEPIGPRLPPLAIGAAEETAYLIPASATLLSRRPADYSGWYSGAEMSLQFLDAFGRGGGVALMVRDLESLEKRYHLSKSPGGVAMGLDYQQRTLAPGETYALAPTEIALHTGDWHAAFHDYCRWADSWYAPATKRPQWWREVFNFRQQFLYRFDRLVEPKTRRYRMETVLEQDQREFGGVDFLHIFDWGYQGPYGRIYGRTGDHDAGEYLPGGWEGFRAAVEGVQRRGVPVGFYIEGYLLDERGKLGQAHGPDWQMAGPDGALLRWPNSTELYICPAVEAWQEVQATTYARMVARMDADGMYLDEFGFAGPGKWCWSPDHGHPVPSSSLQAEQALTRRVREAMSAVKPGTVLYTEDTPTDVNSQYQEGAFCYSMQRHRGSGTLAPLKLFRYAFPEFKNIEILNCDRPTDTWATGVRWTFWNGEALWLEGVAQDWFAPQTRRAVRDCYRVLRAHRNAFAGDRAEPLVPTLAAGLYANRFCGTEETAYTLYNARNETYSGEVLSVPHRPGRRYFDAFAERELQPRLVHGRALLSLALDPQGVGCIVCRPAD